MEELFSSFEHDSFATAATMDVLQLPTTTPVTSVSLQTKDELEVEHDSVDWQ
jgi:hypothetical protein